MTLDDQASAAGLHRDWRDATGRMQRVGDDVLRAVLERLGTRSDGSFVSGRTGEPLTLPEPDDGVATLVLEDGTTQRIMVDKGRVPPIAAIGYHRLEIGGRERTLAVAPTRCAQPHRGWGAAVQIAALRDDHAFGGLETLAKSAAAFGEAGADALAISPTHALFPADPTHFSPYSPSSRLFHNGLLADPGMTDGPPASDLIDWPTALPKRLEQLRNLFGTIDEATRTALAAYRAERGAALEAHALFDTLHGVLGGKGWHDWPSDYQSPNSAAVARLAADHAETIAFHIFLQWLTEQGLAEAQRSASAAGMRIGLIADLAVGIDAGGSHGWSRRDELLTGMTIGAPPDPLGPDGQNWGITSLDPFALHRTGFAAFIETIRTALRHAGGIRIDHAIGLDRLWVIPEGAGAGDGVYLSMPGETLRDIVAIEAHRADAIVIAEDLGTLPPGLRENLSARGMLGMRVLPFEREGDRFLPPAQWDADAVAMTGTHDTPTLAGWWRGRDIDWRESFGRHDDAARADRATDRAALWTALDGNGLPPEEPPIDRILSAVADAPCPLVILPLEDLIGVEEQPNVPGTIDEHPNWRRRMPEPTDALLARSEVAARTQMLRAKRPQ